MKAQGKCSIEVSVDEILQSQTNIGRDERVLSKGLEDRVLFRKNGIVVLNPVDISNDIVNSCEEIYKFAKQGKKILFIDVNPATSHITKEISERVGEYHCTGQWKAGSITNTYTTTFKSSAKLDEMKKTLENEGATMRKKDVILLKKKIDRITKILGGISDIKGRPDLVITIASKENYLPIKECEISQVKKIEFCDTDRFNSSNKSNTERVVGNTEGEKSLRFVLNKFADACLEGRRDRVKSSTGTDFSKILERKKNLDLRNNKDKVKNTNDDRQSKV